MTIKTETAVNAPAVVSAPLATHLSNHNTLPQRVRLTHKYLEPADRLGEILFGVIMVLTVTLTASFAADTGREGVRELLFAAIGCNIAWGFIDGIMYVMSCITERGGQARLILAVQTASSESVALDIVRRTVDSKFELVTELEERNALYRSILAHAQTTRPDKVSVKKEDLLGGVACFWLVFVSCLPAALPFLFLSSPHVALRISNLLMVVMLFVIGMKWAEHAYTNRLWAGLIMATVGLALVGVAILLGG
jgi:VIT family